MLQLTSTKLNLQQNYPNFALNLISKQPPLFKKGLLKKTLNPIQEDLTNARTCTIKCLVKGCR